MGRCRLKDRFRRTITPHFPVTLQMLNGQKSPLSFCPPRWQQLGPTSSGPFSSKPGSYQWMCRVCLHKQFQSGTPNAIELKMLETSSPFFTLSPQEWALTGLPTTVWTLYKSEFPSLTTTIKAFILSLYSGMVAGLSWLGATSHKYNIFDSALQLPCSLPNLQPVKWREQTSTSHSLSLTHCSKLNSKMTSRF